MPDAPDLNTARIVDLTHPMRSGQSAYPGDPVLRCRQHATPDESGYQLTEITFGSHHGTHVDAPAHFFSGAATVDALPLTSLVGPAVVIDLPDRPSAVVEPADLAAHEQRLQSGGRVLFRSGWDAHYGTERYLSGHPGLSPSAARWLVERRIALAGFDTPSPSGDTQEIHEILLGAPESIVIVECLANLKALPSECFLVVLPLKLHGVDGSPVRAIAILP